ncbi:hypothetical protein F4861DRAFT_335945 [Xylaria intraflava]|nr:hypothetical protein F4861DRAFT_335945 [Xylaria intraflava]
MYFLPGVLILLSSLLPVSNAQDSCYGNKSITGYCTPMTYTDTTDNFKTPPTTADCQQTCASVNNDAGDWLVDFSKDADGTHHNIVGANCGFSLSRGANTPQNARFSMANQDILDLYDESLNRFGGNHGGAISAEGTMECGGFQVNWYIKNP